MALQSLWMGETVLPTFPRLHEDVETDVVVIGAGIAGITAARLLRQRGERVVVVEAREVGAGETSRTTAHLTELLDAPYHLIESKFGKPGARLAAESSRAAIDRIETFVSELGNCGFARVPAYVYAETDEQRKELETEYESLQRVGAEVAWVDAFPLPVEVTGALRVERQAQFHPLEYLRQQTMRFIAEGGKIFEHTRVVEVDDGTPCRITTTSGSIEARNVLVLTNAAVSNKVALHTKIAAYRTYAVAAPLESAFPAGLFWDMQSPYHYVRAHEMRTGRFLIIGGEDHKTGQNRETEESFRRLETFASTRFHARVTHRWSGQVMEPADGLPFIGKNSGAEHVYVATGFSGTGMTYGTLAGMILADEVLGTHNPWSKLYEATRVKPLAQAREYVTENVDFPAHLARDRFARGDARSFDDVGRGEGRLVRSQGKMMAVYRDESGAVHVRSAVCPHLGCHVRWNDAERSWDCPCHGSRFDVDGGVLNGPATKDLAEPAGVSDQTERTRRRRAR